MLRGTFTALVTPFKNDEIDGPAFERLIENQIAAGIGGIVPVGTTGESPTLSCGERHHVIELAVETARGRCQVIAGTGSNSTRDAIAHTKEAETIGADGALLVAPYYNKPSQDGLFHHFAAIAEATSLQLVLYNIPGRCAVDIAADTVIRLAEKYSNIVAIKEASGSVDRVSELVRRAPNGFTVLSGDDSLTLPFLSVGAVGVVSVVSNLFPKEIAQFVNLFLEGKAEEARRIHLRFYPLFKDLFCEPNPVPTKTALAWRGAMASDVRLPLCEMTAANATRLRATLEVLEREIG
ncbi:MAG TPA: 4-hydroxy-tetrahydrodipicolinate synthase [Chthoniobacterales bacterium]|nr:4-hydroxy-tetrahydrodipicolinate synthase [Chthoniobacterales bacterium]